MSSGRSFECSCLHRTKYATKNNTQKKRQNSNKQRNKYVLGGPSPTLLLERKKHIHIKADLAIRLSTIPRKQIIVISTDFIISSSIQHQRHGQTMVFDFISAITSVSLRTSTHRKVRIFLNAGRVLHKKSGNYCSNPESSLSQILKQYNLHLYTTRRAAPL